MTQSAFDTKRIIVALDYPDASQARLLLAQLDPTQCRVKIGKELFTRSGPSFVEEVIALGFDVFLDMKYHDIPNTVAKAVLAAAQLGVWMVNVHASGGSEMMSAAAEAVRNESHRPILIAVTVLTSMTQSDLAEIGLDVSPKEQVQRLAALAQRSGMDGVVCSAEEVSSLREALGEDFILVTPGIRPEGDAANDQKRIVTPSAALKAGSHYLVIGRPITQASNPREKLNTIYQQIRGDFGDLC
ncbi:MAG: orotidine-5'-phosphate decarboxylase [Gammaproteobacteria bacterium]